MRQNINSNLLCFLVCAFVCLIPLQCLCYSGTLRVGGEENLPGCRARLSYDGATANADGFYPEILDHIAVKEGWNIEYVPCLWNDCLAKLKNGDLDLLMNTAFTRERAEIYDFNKVTLNRAWGQIFIPRGVNSKIQSFSDLEGMRVAGVSEDTYFTAFKKIFAGLGKRAIYIEAGSFPEVAKMLESGKADAGIVSNMFAQYNEKKYYIKPTPIIFNPIEGRFAATKGMQREVLGKIDLNLQALIENRDSVYYKSMDRWLKVRQSNVLSGWIIVVLASILLIAMLSSIIAVIFRKRVNARTHDLQLEIETRRELEYKYRSIFERSGDGILLAEHVSEKIIFIDSNETAMNWDGGIRPKTRFWGVMLSVYHQRGSLTVVVRRKRLQEYIKIALKLNGVASFEWIHLRSDGSELLVEVKLVPIPVEGKNVFLITWRDISKRKMAEDTLKISEEKYRGIFEKAIEGIFQSTFDGRFISANPALALMMGYNSPDEFLSFITDIAHQVYINPEDRATCLAFAG